MGEPQLAEPSCEHLGLSLKFSVCFLSVCTQNRNGMALTKNELV